MKASAVTFRGEFDVRGAKATIRGAVDIQFDGSFAAGNAVTVFGNTRTPRQWPEGGEPLSRNGDFFLDSYPASTGFDRQEMAGIFPAQADFQFIGCDWKIALIDARFGNVPPSCWGRFNQELSFDFHMAIQIPTQRHSGQGMENPPAQGFCGPELPPGGAHVTVVQQKTGMT